MKRVCLGLARVGRYAGGSNRRDFLVELGPEGRVLHRGLEHRYLVQLWFTSLQ